MENTSSYAYKIIDEDEAGFEIVKRQNIRSAPYSWIVSTVVFALLSVLLLWKNVTGYSRTFGTFEKGFATDFGTGDDICKTIADCPVHRQPGIS
jgi:hypothetical protein